MATARRRGRTHERLYKRVARDRARLEENLGSATIELTLDDLREIDAAASSIAVQGARYPEELERLSYR